VSGGPTRRLFFALWPDDATRRRIAALAREIAPQPVPAANLHLTLAFLGPRTAAELDCLQAAAGEVRAEPFELELDFLGGWARKRIQWLGTSHIPAALTALVAALNAALAGCGYEPESRPYAPHITLSRKARQPVSRRLEAPVRWPVGDFVLAESVATDGGVRYEVLARWPLG